MFISLVMGNMTQLRGGGTHQISGRRREYRIPQKFLQGIKELMDTWEE